MTLASLLARFDRTGASPADRPARRRSSRRGEAGFTMIEVVIALALAVITIGALTELFVTGHRSALGTQRQSELLAVADQQIETIREQVKTTSGGFAALAMNATPAAGSSATLPNQPYTYTDPNHFVTSATSCGPSSLGYLIETNWDDTHEGTLSGVPAFSNCPTAVEPLVVSSAGLVTPKTTGVTVGSGTATVYRYVTATNVGCSTSGGADYVSPTAGSCYADARRVIVAVVLDAPGGSLDTGQTSPAYVSTIITNPVPSNQANSSLGLTLGLTVG